MSLQNQESLAKATKQLMLEEPFYGLLLLGLNKIWDKGIPTACVGMQGIDFNLRINPDFWNSLPFDHKKGLLKHEMMHIGFFHLTDFSHLADKKIANIAMDIEINQYIPENQKDENWLSPKHPAVAHLQLEPNKGTFYYYEKLMEDQQKCNQQLKDCIKQALENGESECTLPDGSKVKFTNHDWEDAQSEDGKMSEAKTKIAKAQVERLLGEVADQVEKSRGTIPGQFQEIIKRIRTLEPPKFDWKGYLRRFIGKSSKTYTKKTRRKYNKRMPDFPGMKIKRQKHAFVAIDTSASVRTKELKEFIQEIHHIYKTGTDVTICECDTAISYISKFDPKRDFEVHGRGGTDFQPVIDYYNKNAKEYSCLFYFTDGEAPPPENCTGNILWVLSGESNMNEDLPGPVIKLEL